MKSPIQFQLCLATVSALVLLGGCASAGNAPSAGMAAHEPMDMQAMCAKHKQMMAGKSQQEQQAMMQEQMKSMSPEMRERMHSMMQQCR